MSARTATLQQILQGSAAEAGGVDQRLTGLKNIILVSHIAMSCHVGVCYTFTSFEVYLRFFDTVSNLATEAATVPSPYYLSLGSPCLALLSLKQT